ncbi:MAG: NUDIX domain-containing protein, partial [Bacteroidia bacterium]|nr:NUDIX domain-containing protein [Bacteroidia bacterium]
FIFRRGKWDFPKGKLDNGETLEDCAIREVQEETGLNKIKLIAPLAVTYHTYHEGTKFILKESHWYTMKVKGEQALTPQTEEDILDIKWVKANNMDQYRKDSFPSIEDVINAFQKKI